MNEDENELILAQDKAQDKAQDEIVNEKISNMNEEEKKITGEIDISKTIESNIDYWRNKCFEQQKEIEELSIIKNSIQTLETHFVNDDTYYVIAKKNFLEGDFRHLLDDYISKDEIRHIRDKAECMDYYSLNDVIDDLSKLLGDENNE